MVVTRLRIQLAGANARELPLQPHLRLRRTANRWSKVSPIYNRPAALVKAPKQDSKPGVLQDSPIRATIIFFRKISKQRNLLRRTLRHQFHRNLATETANLPGAISEDRCANYKAGDSS